MTVGGDYISDRDYDVAPNYPVVFGVRLTPIVNGWLIAGAGLFAAAYILLNFVKPVWDTSQQLSADIAAKQSQLLNREETQRQIQQARANLQAAKKLKADVLSLFANDPSMDTLLLDLNERVQSANAGIADPDRRATLSKFTLNDALSGVVNDSSLGPTVNGKLERRVFDVQMQGSFPQTQSIIRSIERLQPLLVVRNFKSELNQDTRAIVLDDQGRLAAGSQPIPTLTTSFRLIALIPAAAEQPATASPTPGATTTPGTSATTATPVASPTISPATTSPAASPATTSPVASPATPSTTTPRPAATTTPARSTPATSPAATSPSPK
jgi:type IV pilus assembly protein PilO